MRYLLIETHRDSNDSEQTQNFMTGSADQIKARVDSESKSYGPQQWRYTYEIIKVKLVSLDDLK